MNNKWKITYLDLNNQITVMFISGPIENAANTYPPNSYGPSSIIKIEVDPILITH